jgi:SAM-dependent methyltransferase
MKPSEYDVLLEIGGPSGGSQKVISFFRDILVANLEDRKSMQRCNYPENAQLILSDGTILPLKDKSVDFVFSNATLEHIPKERWPLLAQEIKRVARKGYFISAPNYYFPFEPHYLMPFFQFIPESFKQKLVIDHGLTIGWMSKTTYQRINLPKKGELQCLFPQAEVKGGGWGKPLLPFHWICWERKVK